MVAMYRPSLKQHQGILIHTHLNDSQSLQQWTLNESIITKTGDQVVVQNPERKEILNILPENRS
jgi:hypothetical protein